MQLAIAAIGIAVVVMVGYLVVGQVRVALPTFQAYHTNDCVGTLVENAVCTPTGCADVFAVNATPGINTSAQIMCTDTTVGAGQNSAMTTVFAGLALVAVGIIVLAAFGLIQVFQ